MGHHEKRKKSGLSSTRILKLCSRYVADNSFIIILQIQTTQYTI